MSISTSKDALTMLLSIESGPGMVKIREGLDWVKKENVFLWVDFSKNIWGKFKKSSKIGL